MYASPPENNSQVQKEKKKNISSSLVYVLHKREIRHFQAVVVQRRQTNVQKRLLYVQSCCRRHQIFRLLFLTAMQTYCYNRHIVTGKRIKITDTALP